VYPTTRTWQNWLWYEWLFRTQLDTIIPIFHETNQLQNFNHAPYKIIICTIDPNLALKMYMKLNSNLNNLPINTFLSKIEESNNINSKFHQEQSNRSILIKVDNLFNPILDQSIYDTIVDFTNFDYLYDECQPIHNRWFNLHKKSEKEFVEYITNFYL
jgi:hypothetical protein